MQKGAISYGIRKYHRNNDNERYCAHFFNYTESCVHDLFSQLSFERSFVQLDKSQLKTNGNVLSPISRVDQGNGKYAGKRVRSICQQRRQKHVVTEEKRSRRIRVKVDRELPKFPHYFALFFSPLRDITTVEESAQKKTYYKLFGLR